MILNLFGEEPVKNSVENKGERTIEDHSVKVLRRKGGH